MTYTPIKTGYRDLVPADLRHKLIDTAYKPTAEAIFQVDQARKAARKRKKEELDQAAIEVARQAWRDFRRHIQENVDWQHQQRELQKPPLQWSMGGTMVIQLSDLHFGSLILRPEMGNLFNMEIAGKRLRYYASRALSYATANDIHKLVIALTGDAFDSSGKIGKMSLEKAAMSTGPMMMVLTQGIDLIYDFVMDMVESNMFDDILLAGVIGNEARLTTEISTADLVACENLDAGLNAILSMRFRNHDLVRSEFSLNRKIVEVEDQRILIAHGHNNMKVTDQKSAQAILDQHRCDYGLSGHVHHTWLTGNWARSSSLCGDDSYGGDRLGYQGSPSQNLIICNGRKRELIAVDLGDVGDQEGYQKYRYNGAFGVSDRVEISLADE